MHLFFPTWYSNFQTMIVCAPFISLRPLFHAKILLPDYQVYSFSSTITILSEAAEAAHYIKDLVNQMRETLQKA